MTTFFRNLCARHSIFWPRHTFSLLGSVLFFLVALVVQHFAYNYVDNGIVGTHVGDLFLDNVPAVNVDYLIVEGALIMTVVVLWLLILRPQYVLFSLKTLALFIIIRSFFISLTHLGTNLHQITLDTNSIGFSIYNFLYLAKNDFFFSGHVGAPFMFGLIFWKDASLRYFFFAVSFVLGATMILAHMHYSIDIFAAPFITYGIFVISKKLFLSDYQLI